MGIVDRYRIVFTGSPMGGFRLDDVKSSFARLTSAEPAVVDRIFSGNSVVIRKDMPHDTAYTLAQRMRDIGMTIELQPLGPAIDTSHLSLVVEEGEQDSAADSPPAPPSPSAESMQCPKCGHEQPSSAECRACGVIIAKVLEMQRQVEQEAEQPAEETVEPRQQRAPGTPHLSRKQAWQSTLKTMGPVLVVLFIGYRWFDRLTPDVASEAEIREIYVEACADMALGMITALTMPSRTVSVALRRLFWASSA